MRRIVRLDPKKVRISELLQFGQECLKEMQYSDALEFFEEAIRTDSTEFRAFIGVGRACLAIGKAQEAVQAFLRAQEMFELVSTNPASVSPVICYFLALGRKETDNLSEGIRLLKLAAKKLFPNFGKDLTETFTDSDSDFKQFRIMEAASMYSDAFDLLEPIVRQGVIDYGVKKIAEVSKCGLASRKGP